MLPEEIYQARAIQEIERVVIEQHGVSGIVLMRRAGEAAFKQIMTRYSSIHHLVVVCGAGNNGGDGYVVALCARKIGIRVTVRASAAPATDDAATALREYQDHGGALSAGDDSILNDADLIVDALFGTGLSRAPEGIGAELIRRMNDADCPVVSLDMPSGLHSDTGFACESCVKADTTITFIGLKLGLLTGQGRGHAGAIVFEDLDIPTAARRTVKPVARIIQRPLLPKRAREMHKGDAGRVLVVGGDISMLGAVLLAGEAALRCGSGLVTVAGGESHLNLPALHCPELMSADALQLPSKNVSANADAVVLGPGLGRSRWSEQVFDRFITNDRPMVVDADGLHWLARAGAQSQPHRSCRILTPHPGEAGGLLQCTAAEIQADRPAAAREIAGKFGGICILKGAGTLVACADRALFLCDKGNPGMASAGMGDVLSGIIGSLLGQGLPATAAAIAGVWIHGSAADAAVQSTGQRSLLARDVIHHVASVIMGIESP